MGAAVMKALVMLCVLASLSGCLTAAKIHRWESGRAGRLRRTRLR